MDELALGAYLMATGYFVPRRALEVRTSSAPACEEGGLQLVSSHAGASTLKQAALELINRAQKTVFLASFLLGDEELFGALSAAADRMKGGVYLVTAMSEPALRRGLAEVDDLAPAETQARAKQFPWLAERGLALRGHDSCHAKFLVADRNVALVSTANFDKPGFQKTTELGVVVRSAPAVRRLTALFARLWAEASWDVASGDTYVLSRRRPELPRVALAPDGGSEPEIVWTVAGQPRIQQATEALIASAQREVLLCSYTLSGLAKGPHAIVEALARRRRLTPRILVRARNHMPALRRDAGALAQAGVEVLADSATHLKCVVVDSREVLMSSANLDVEHGLVGGFEVGLRSDARALVLGIHGFVADLLACASHEFRPTITVGELARAPLARVARWPFSSRLAVRCHERCWAALRSAALVGPALFGVAPDGVTLWAGKHRWRMTGLDAREQSLELLAEQGLQSDELLDRWIREGTPETGPRGLCDATLVRM